MTSQQPPVARFVGSASVGKRRLVRALVSRRQGEGNDGHADGPLTGAIVDDGEKERDGNDGSDRKPVLWRLETRYYTTTIALERSRLPEGDDANVDVAPPLAAAAEAVVLVFDASREGTFSAVKRWWSSHSTSSGGDLDPAVKLCVAYGTSFDARGDREELVLTDAEEWCVDNAFELIEVEGGSSSRPCEFVSGIGESGGVGRLADALAAHAWPGLVRKPLEEVEAARRAAVAGAAAERLRTNGSSGGARARDERDVKRDEAYVPPSPIAGPADFGGDDDDPLAAASDALSPGSEGIAGCRGATGVDGLEEMFRGLSAARAAAASLPDEERREAAAAVALRLAEALGIDDEEDGGDSSDEDGVVGGGEGGGKEAEV